MTTADLFVHTPQLTFEKTTVIEKAASAQLDEDPEAWPRQILTELFRTTPETSDYTPRVQMMKVDEEQGYGLGVVLVENSTDSALSVARPGPASKRVLVPIVIKNHELSPLDLIMLRNGRMLPLNGHTLREALFRPETFELTTEDYGDTSLWSQFYPPGRSDNDFGAGIAQGMGGGAQGAATFIYGPGMKHAGADEYKLLGELAPTLYGQDLDKLAGDIQEPDVAPRLTKDSPLFGAVQLLSNYEKTAVRDGKALLKAASVAAAPDVIQMGWSVVEDRYWVKMASREAFSAPRPYYMTRAEALKFAGSEIVHKVDTDGVVTVGPAPVKTTQVSLDASSWEVIEKPGIYKVKTVHGKEQIGWVIPKLYDADGTFIPMAVFTNGAAAMVQDQIVGAHVATGVDLPAGPAKGTGVFYCAGQGGVVATVPLMVQGAEESADGDKLYLVKTLTGEESRIRLVPGLQKLLVLKGEFHMPESSKFLPLNEETMVPLIEDLGSISKTAADLLVPTITLFGGDPTEVSVRFQNMPKLAKISEQTMNPEDAVFMLVLAGLEPKIAHTKLAAASTGRTVDIAGVVDVKLAADLAASTRKTAEEHSHAVMALRQHLVKEAAVLPNAMTVDAVLSLGFINSENVRTFISCIPYLEKCLSKTCELVLASRLGLTEIPEFAAARAARALDEVIQGLKALALRDTSEDASVSS